MPCDRCQESREAGDRYCSKCGEYVGGDCERCEESRRAGARFCIYCGRPLFELKQPLSTKDTLLKIGFIVGLVTTVIWGLYLIFELLVAYSGFMDIFSKLAGFSSSLVVVIPEVTSFWTLKGTGLQVYWVLLVIALTACLAYLFYKAAGPIRKYVKEKDEKAIANTALFEVCVLFAALYAFEFVMSMILLGMGVDMDNLPDRETWQWMFDLLEAPVWEEIITRILYLGVPMTLYYLITRKKKAWKCILGGNIKIDRVALIFIIFSAFMFGAGHLTNWGTWKFIPTFIFGLMAGYLFCKYGVYATVAFHFLTDYLQASEWAFGSEVIYALLILVTAFACAPYLYIYGKKGVLAAIRIIKGDH